MEQTISIKDKNANPAPLGLLGFGLTTVLLNFHNAGLYGLDAMIIGMGIFVGGLAQIIAGILEFKKNNTFGMTAFVAYGFFWISLCTIWLLPNMFSDNSFKPNATSIGYYLLMWGIFSTFMFIGTLRLNRMLQLAFGTLVVLFFLLAAAKFTGSHIIERIAGIDGIICGSIAIYGAMAQVLNEVYGKVILPIDSAK
jgi:succinate-acetate transporter protein